MSAMQEAAWRYVESGYALAAWERTLGKGPRESEWGLQAFPPEHVTEQHNIGVNHALSGTAVLDADDLERTRTALEFLGLDLDDLARETTTWRGHPERQKLLFRAPEPMLPVKKLTIWLAADDADAHTVLELRGAADGKQAQDVLPPSIHPGTGQPYRFDTELRPRDALPEMPPALLDVWRNWDRFKPMLRWLLGCAKTPAPHPERPRQATQGDGPSVIVEFNRRYTAGEILERNGYVRQGKRWLRPGSKTGVAGIVQLPDGAIYAHGGGVLADEKPHDAFDCYRILEHGEDWTASVRAAAELLGMNRPRHPAEDAGKADDPGKAWSVEPLDILRQTVAPGFEADDVPPELGRFASEWAAAAGFDPSGVIAATVGAAAACMSDGLRLEVNPASRHYESARLWLLLIGPPGVAKSPSLAQACEPIKEMHRELHEEWQRECARLRAAAERQDEPPELPPRPSLYVTDATTEALAETLAHNPRGLLTIYDELDSWLGSHDAYRSGGGKDRGEWLRAYDGGPHTVERIKRGAFYVPNWGIGILAATTPSALQRHARKLPADGLLQRFIPVLVQPGGKADRRADVSPTAQAYHNVMVRLYQYGPGSGVRIVRMTDEAAELLHAERERLRSLALAVQVYGDGFAGHVAKHAAMLARIALVFHAVTGREHPAERRLEVDAVRLATRFMRKALRHAQALYGDLLGQEGAVSLARAVAAVLLADKRQEITRRELVHSCHAWRKSDDDRHRDEAMRFLVDVGWLREEHGDYIKPHVTRWSINPAVHERFAEHGEQHRERRRIVLEAIRGASR